MTTRNDELRQLRDEHKQRHQDIARLCDSVENTVRNWFTKSPSREIPLANLTLLKIRLLSNQLSPRQLAVLPAELIALINR